MKILGFGANLNSAYGTPRQTIQAAINALNARGIKTVQLSQFYVSEPVPKSDQPLYTNCVAAIETALTPDEVLTIVNDVEAAFGRVRRQRDEARPIDIDLLDFDALEQNKTRLTLPHPRLHERAFVLYPMRDIAPDWVHPVSGIALSALIAALPDNQIISLYDAA